MKIVMIGSGYVGLVSGVCFADFGHTVTCVDKDTQKIESLQNGKVPIFEPGLEEMMTRNVAEKRLTFTTNLPEAMQECDAIFIAVGTPSRRGDGFADLSYVYAAAEEIAANLKSDFTVIVNKSTVPVGTGDEVANIINKHNPNADVAVVSNPEFLREGAAIDDFKHPDRIVIGTDDQRAKDVMQAIYRPLYLNEAPLVFTTRRSSEMIKYAANAFLATKITFINEMANLCEAMGANVQDVARGIGMDKRIGSKFLHAGPGFGGSCFPKDTRALAEMGQRANAPQTVVEAVISSNETRKKAMAQKIIAGCHNTVAGKTIAILGLTFKPNTDDMREAPSIEIIKTLQNQGAQIKAFDPQCMQHAKLMFENVTFCSDAYTCATDADALVIITEWEQFRALDLKRIKALLKTPSIIDLRNIYTSKEVRDQGLTYTAVGKA